MDPFTIKPIDAEGIIANAKECGGRILVVEDHYPEVSIQYYNLTEKSSRDLTNFFGNCGTIFLLFLIFLRVALVTL